MLVREIMQKRVATVEVEDTLATAQQMMLWTGTTHLPVVKDGALVGMLTEHDVLRAQVDDPRRQRLALYVASAMTKPVETANPDELVALVCGRMARAQLSAVPVVADGALVGLLTTTDVMIAFERHAAGALDPAEAGVTTAGDLMARNVVTASPEDTLATAAARMMHQGVRHLPVVDGDGVLIGILSDRDLRVSPRLLKRGADEHVRTYLESTKVGAAMTPRPITVQPDADLATLRAAFADWHLSAVPVVDKAGMLMGIVSYVDLIAGAVRRQAERANGPRGPVRPSRPRGDYWYE